MIRPSHIATTDISGNYANRGPNIDDMRQFCVKNVRYAGTW